MLVESYDEGLSQGNLAPQAISRLSKHMLQINFMSASC